MKTLPQLLAITLGLCIAPSGAFSQIIYDDFNGPAASLVNSTSAAKWTTLLNDTAALNGSGLLTQNGGGATSDITSTSSFNITTTPRFQFQVAPYGSFFGGFGIKFSDNSNILVRNDLGGSILLLSTFNGVLTNGTVTLTPGSGATNLWEVGYFGGVASVYKDGALLDSVTIAIGSTSAQFNMFQYGSPSFGTSYNYVATVPEPSTAALLATIPVLFFLVNRRRSFSSHARA